MDQHRLPSRHRHNNTSAGWCLDECWNRCVHKHAEQWTAVSVEEKENCSSTDWPSKRGWRGTYATSQFVRLRIILIWFSLSWGCVSDEVEGRRLWWIVWRVRRSGLAFDRPSVVVVVERRDVVTELRPLTFEICLNSPMEVDWRRQNLFLRTLLRSWRGPCTV